jgi:hypothetical protein
MEKDGVVARLCTPLPVIGDLAEGAGTHRDINPEGLPQERAERPSRMLKKSARSALDTRYSGLFG